MTARRSPSAAPTKSEGSLNLGEAVLREVRVNLQVRLGEVTLSLEALSALSAGSTLKLDTALGEPVALCLNGSVVARGEIVAVDDHFGVRLCEVGAAA